MYQVQFMLGCLDGQQTLIDMTLTKEEHPIQTFIEQPREMFANRVVRSSDGSMMPHIYWFTEQTKSMKEDHQFQTTETCCIYGLKTPIT